MEEIDFMGVLPIKELKEKGPRFRMTGTKFFATYPHVNRPGKKANYLFRLAERYKNENTKLQLLSYWNREAQR